MPLGTASARCCLGLLRPEQTEEKQKGGLVLPELWVCVCGGGGSCRKSFCRVRRNSLEKKSQERKARRGGAREASGQAVRVQRERNISGPSPPPPFSGCLPQPPLPQAMWSFLHAAFPGSPQRVCLTSKRDRPEKQDCPVEPTIREEPCHQWQHLCWACRGQRESGRWHR